ncbi:MAG: SixA phosphatase family protein [Candidatus Nanopelagicales bacterium]
MGIRTLVVVRHAKSDYPPGVPDFARPLAERGRGAAPVMGRWIAGNVDPIEVALVSPAKRAQETFALLSSELPALGEIRTDERIYEAWGNRLVQVVSELPTQVEVAVLVGHEPGVSDLALHLSDGQNHKLHRRIAEKYPTCGVAVLRTAAEWADLVPGCAELSEFVAPGDFA